MDTPISPLLYGNIKFGVCECTKRDFGAYLRQQGFLSEHAAFEAGKNDELWYAYNNERLSQYGQWCYRTEIGDDEVFFCQHCLRRLADEIEQIENLKRKDFEHELAT